MTNYNELLNIAIEAAIEAGKGTLKYYFGVFDIHYKSDNSPLTLADLESNRIINTYLNLTSIPLISEENENIPFEVRKDWQQFWLIDPLDGTKEFINRSDEFTINIALIENGKPILGVVYVPVKELLYFGYEGSGSFKIVLNGEFNLKDILTKAQVLIPDSLPEIISIVASKSHLTKETTDLIKKIGKKIPVGDLQPFGSSLKLCMVAEGKCQIYPRIGPTMEWDIAAGHAVAEYAKCSVIDLKNMKSMVYNKENLINPDFIVFHPLLTEVIKSLME